KLRGTKRQRPAMLIGWRGRQRVVEGSPANRGAPSAVAAVAPLHQCPPACRGSTGLIHIGEMISGVFGPSAPPHQIRHVSQRDESTRLAGFIPVAGNDF